MKLGWYLNRLRSMRPREVAHRLAERVRRSASRSRHEGWARYSAGPLHNVFPAWRERIDAALPAQRAAIRETAAAFLAGEYSALGQTWPKRDPQLLFPAGIWALDPLSGTAWPSDAYCFDIALAGDPRRGDVKYVWEFNRLQFLPMLATHAVVDGSPAALEAIEAAIASWHAANPPFRGVGWASGIEVALRSISIIIALAIAGDRLGAETKRLAAGILVTSRFWLRRFPSLHSSANNHRVAELAGEALIDMAVGRDAHEPLDELDREIAVQLLPDGSGAEQSPTYAAFTAELALLCAAASRQYGRTASSTTMDRLASFAEFVEWLGALRFGDDDEGRAVTLGGETHYAMSVAAAIRGFIGLPGQPTPDRDLRGVLFAGPMGNRPAPVGLKSFASGGLSVWRGEIAGRTVQFSLDHGPLGYLSIAAHGHADALTITLTIDQRPVLIDPGTYLYGSGAAWRDWFRSTPAHNTLSIAGQSQSVISGPFNWSHKASASLDEALDGPDWMLRASQNGYLRRFGVVHERWIRREANEIVIGDRLTGGTLESEIVFQLAPGLAVAADGDVAVVSAGDGPLLRLTLPDASFTVRQGETDSLEDGWVSPSFGLRVPAARLVWRGRVGADAVTTRLTPVPRDA